MRFFLILFFYTLVIYPQSNDPLIDADLINQKKWVDSIYNNLSLEEKIGQLFFVWASPDKGEQHFRDIKKQIIKNNIGGIIFSLGGPTSHINWLNSFQDLSRTPLLISMDAEWGVAMRLDSVQPFPWNMTLGAIQDNQLIQEIGNRIGQQAKRLGIHMNFSPVVDINTNPNNPIIGNRSFGENKINVTNKSLAMMKGMETAGILTSAKHFPGHGDTSQDSHKVLPKIKFSKARIDSIELFPYRELIKKGLSSVMIAHLNIPSYDKNIPSSMSENIVTDLLKNKLNFNGLIITDALDMKGATSLSKNINLDLQALIAGNDILLMSNDVSKGIKEIKKAYMSNIISEERLSYSVKKILKAKFKAGLNETKEIKKDNILKDLNSDKDRRLYSKAITRAITVLKNNNDLIPLSRNKKYGLITLGDSNHNYFYNELSKNIDVVKFNLDTSIEDISKKIDSTSKIIISFHRSNSSPYNSLKFSTEEINLINKIAKIYPIILNVFANPYSLSQIKSFNNIDALVVSYQNSEISQIKSAHILLGKENSSGRLPVSINNFFSVGSGINTGSNYTLGYGDPKSVGISSEKLKRIDYLINISIDSLMVPGAQVLISRKGKIFYHKTFGYHTYKKINSVKKSDLYDLASLTKILATLPLIIKEVDYGGLDLNDKLGDLFPEYNDTNKANIKVIDILTHYARLKPWIPFYIDTQKKGNKLQRKIYRKKRNEKFPNEVAKGIFINKNQNQKILDQIFDSELRDTLEYKYSDFPFIILQKFLEKKYKLPLDKIAENKIFNPLKLKSTGFNPLRSNQQFEIIPSEIDNYYRKQELKGYVHDMAAAMFGGVAGHAGLFSNAKEIATIMQMYLNKGTYNGNRFFSSKIFDDFNTCIYCDKNNRRGIGFDKPQISGSGSTCGCVSKSSFGHSGFTGTYTWADPENGIVYVFLSNRTYPTMKNNLLIDHSIRTRIQKIIYDSIID